MDICLLTYFLCGCLYNEHVVNYNVKRLIITVYKSKQVYYNKFKLHWSNILSQLKETILIMF